MGNDQLYGDVSAAPCGDRSVIHAQDFGWQGQGGRVPQQSVGRARLWEENKTSKRGNNGDPL